MNLSNEGFGNGAAPGSYESSYRAALRQARLAEESKKISEGIFNFLEALDNVPYMEN